MIFLQKCSKKTSHIFFQRKKNIFLELEDFFVYSFDAENAYLSIGGILGAIRVTQMALLGL